MELLRVTADDKQAILEKYGMDQEKIDRDVRIVEEWLVKQPHLPQKMQFDNFIEKILLNSKFRIEVAKEKIDSLCCVRNIAREYYECLGTPKFVLPSQHYVLLAPLPILGPSKERLLILKMRSPDPDLYEFIHFAQITVSLLELLLKYDYCDGIRVIVDMEPVQLGHIKKVDLAGIPKVMAVLAAWIVNIAKSTLKPKIAERFVIHDSLESLHRRVPKNYLPKDFGGTLEESAGLLGSLDRLVQENFQYLMDCIKYSSNENLRVGKPKYTTDMFGVDGTFKKLNVD